MIISPVFCSQKCSANFTTLGVVHEKVAIISARSTSYTGNSECVSNESQKADSRCTMEDGSDNHSLLAEGSELDTERNSEIAALKFFHVE